ncbi:hypothetical protein SBOR_3302 [Sclerotinia borealis F-4128]|uniref:Uncharacterized protein n=1 Tax=Sclerotinia borealis (strain F-4128) TaxID=1432307 RepID=W9CNY6_SCLBF|nr:hypothetical protein SBOR_3302 [Sclerotinia borealis F-4128]
MSNSFDSSFQEPNDMDYEYELQSEMPAPSPMSLNGRQFTVNLKPPMSQNTKSAIGNAHSQVKAPKQSILDSTTPLAVRLQNLKLGKHHATSQTADKASFDLDLAEDLEKDFEDAWNEQSGDGDDGSMVVERNTPKSNRRPKQTTSHQKSKPRVQPVIDAGPTIICRQCKMAYRYRLSETWAPGQRPPRLVTPYSKKTQSHLHIATCVNCSFGTCLACGEAPHLKQCTFSDTRVAWYALCSVDEAVISYRQTSPYLTSLHNARDVQPVLLQALTTLNATVSRNGTSTFGFDQLLRKSMLLDLIADIMRDTTVENIELSPLLIQTWELVNMVAKHSELRDTLFEQRQTLKETSLGLRKLVFPLVLLPVRQSSNINPSNRPVGTYSCWSLLQRCSEVAKQYIHANHDDVWSAATLAQRVIEVYEIMASKVPSKPLLPEKTHSTQHLEVFAAGLRDLYRIGTLRNTQENKIDVQGKTDSESPQKKRGRKREAGQGQGQDQGMADRGGKRQKVVSI